MSLQAALEALFSGEDERAEAAVESLRRAGRGALPALRERLSDTQPDRRWWALRALAEIDDPSVPPLLVGALADPDAGVRQCAALALRQRPSPQAVLPLIAALSDPDPLTAALAADALAAGGEPAVLPLLEAFAGLLLPARILAARSLAHLKDPRAIPALFHALEDESALVVHWAEHGLERLGVGMSFFSPD